jgi:uncharacterized protein YbbC (DUF1343 family)
MKRIYASIGFIVVLLTVSCKTNTTTKEPQITPKNVNTNIVTGAEQTAQYLPYLKGKRIALLSNPTAIIGKTHLVDSLKNIGVKIMKVFGPEHGFRGNASAGTEVGNEKDAATGLKIISLYGKKRKPTKEDLDDVDLMIFDIQDVGCRFYTYINVLRDVMESCAENGKELLILDRPNPNGYLVDGPVLDMSLKSGVGQFPIPIAHGMTIAEFAQMINGEGWLPEKKVCKLKIIKMLNYDHEMPYTLPVKPSPNLNTQQSIMLYPTLCLYEGTSVSQGRGTYFPFSVLGSPVLKDKYPFSFTPVGIKGMAETPLHKDVVCYGLDLREYDINNLRTSKRINLQWMIDLYKAFPDKTQFFDRNVSKQIMNIDILAGVSEFKKQIIEGKTMKEIQDSWEPQLSNYKVMRLKYLIYP